RVGERERCADDAVVLFAPSELGDQGRCEHAQHRAIDVVDRGGEEQECAYDPPIVADTYRRGERGCIAHGRVLMPLRGHATAPFQCLLMSYRPPRAIVIALSVTHSPGARPLHMCGFFVVQPSALL